MKKFLNSFLMLFFAISSFVLASCDDDKEDALSGICGTYEYHISGYVSIDTENFELPAESGTLEIYESGEKEWNLKMIFVSENGRSYTAEGSSEDRSFFGMRNAATTYTIDDDGFHTNMYGQGNIDAKGNIELSLSLLGYGINSNRKLTNKEVRLLAIKK